MMVSMAPTPLHKFLCGRHEGAEEHFRPQKMDDYDPQKPGENVTQ
jgi:hypothetical protein